MNNTYPNQTTSIPDGPNKSSRSWIYWLIGCCVLLIIGAIGIAIALAYGAFNLAKNIPKPDLSNIESNLEDKFTDQFDDQFSEQFNQELADLEEKLSEMEKGLKDETTPDNSSTPPTTDTNGSIEGNLSYPSEVIPDLTVCAEDISGGKTPVCTTELINNPKYTAGRGFKLNLPAGKYYVYSYLDPSYKAYYTEFVLCGMDISCPSHAKITVTVTSGSHQTNIDPTDWYNY